MIVNDLINDHDQTRLYEIPWGIPLVRYINRFSPHKLMPVTTKMSEVRVFLTGLPNDVFFEILSREIAENDEYTGEIWIKLKDKHGVYIKARKTDKLSSTNTLANKATVLGLVFLFLFVVKASFDFAVTGEFNVELIDKVIEIIISLLKSVG